MNKTEYNKIVKTISETQGLGKGTVDDVITQYFDLAHELAEAKGLTGPARSATLEGS